MTKTIRFYRDLLGMELCAGIGHGGYRHYFFRFGDNMVAFFEYDVAKDMEKKHHGVKTDKPLGFDHVSFSVLGRDAEPTRCGDSDGRGWSGRRDSIGPSFSVRTRDERLVSSPVTVAAYVSR